MAWIESHQSLQRHPKLLRLASLTRKDRVALIGHLQCLWWWALDYADDGYVGVHGPEAIAAGAEWRKDPEAFSDALKESGWLDQDGKLHNWERYVGRLLDKRETKQAGGRARAAGAQRNQQGQFVGDAGPAEPPASGQQSWSSKSPADQLTDLPTNQPTVTDLPNRTEPSANGMGERTAIKDALVDFSDWDRDLMTPSRWKEVEREAKEAHTAGFDPEDIATAAKDFRRRYPRASLTPHALVRHFPMMEAQP